ncbi:TIGR03885 family FMN-dependent LLM class oxidoreductase [Pedobacter faecalis]|uniref:TIGR03885 family FMN-dependent LLM class oxidoreductase n=1 Tax=Pedobacter faecalis TaxID=3041495 RepID=UPI00254DA69A|nr:TIGR03885 family FMN-dependent LLM class oxidoreductase [Pedobacter sp. ELA7]
MTTFAYHASHEQFRPSELLRYAAMAERVGFDAIASSDHFHPWSHRQGQSGFSFAWLGAAMHATSLPYSVVCAPGQRYHPAVVAQAIATLAEMFPGRFDINLGSGEALNENITGEKWPAKQTRNERLLECAEIIRRLLNGETVSHKGLVTVETARLYTLPEQKPRLFCAAVSKETAAWAGTWTDGLITVHQPYEELKKVVDAFRSNGGADKPVHLKVQLSYASSEEQAFEGAYEQWRTNIFQGTVLGDMPTPEHFDAAAEFVKREDLQRMVRVSASLEEHAEWIKQDLSLGFERIALHNVNREQEAFISDFGRQVLPRFS